MIKVYYTLIKAEIARQQALENILQPWLAQLPPAKREQIERIKVLQAKLCSLTGLQLLKHAMLSVGRPDFSLSSLVFDGDRKPACPGFPDFNISHSKELVACAVAEQGIVGIDIEERRVLKTDLRRTLSPEEQRLIEQTPTRFFDFWTCKEAVIKADGDGGVWDMQHVLLNGKTAEFRGQHWQVSPLELHPNYAGFIATDLPDTNLMIEELTWESLANG